jgi:hypothetical protein
MYPEVRGCIQKFPDWMPGARPANGTALCRWMQLYRYSVSQVSLVSFAAITLCVASQRMFIVVYFVIDSVRKLLDTPSYCVCVCVCVCFCACMHAHVGKQEQGGGISWRV